MEPVTRPGWRRGPAAWPGYSIPPGTLGPGAGILGLLGGQELLLWNWRRASCPHPCRSRWRNRGSEPGPGVTESSAVV